MKIKYLFTIINYLPVVILLTSLVITITSCSDDRSLFPTEVPVVFTSGIDGRDVSTRASNNLWSADDRVGIYMTPSDDSNLANAYKKNIEYKAASGGTSTSLVAVGSSIEFPGEERVKFVAYYPYKSTLSNHIYSVDVTTQAPFSNIDLLYHSSTSTHERTSPNVSLGFTHQLSKFTVSVVPGTGVTTNLSATTASLSGFPLRGSFNLSNGTLSNLNTVTAFTPVKNPSTAVKASFECILVPHLGTAGYTRTITLTIGGQNYSYTLPVTRNFDPGKAYNYEFTFTGSQIVLAQNSITEWGGGTIAWGDNLLSSDKTFLDLPATVSSGSVKISTTATATATFELSNAADRVTPDKPAWITGITLPKGTVSGGWTPYTLSFNTIETKFITPRTAYIHLLISGLTVVVRVTKAAVALFLSDPSTATFTLDAATQSKTFTYTTNSEEAAPTLTYSLNGTTKVTKPDWLTVNTPSRTANNATGVSTFSTTFSVRENESFTADRTCYIHYKHGQIEKAVKIEQQKTPSITVTGAANCHMVAPGTVTILIPVERAVNNGGMPATATFTAEEVWDDNYVVSKVGVLGSGSTGYIAVKVHPSNQGNALVALKVGNVIYWSWHIWVTPYNPTPSTTANTWTFNGNVFMDRNLGATNNRFDAASYGMLYQWGRKDPFPTYNFLGYSTAEGPVTNVTTTVRNPARYYYSFPEYGYNWINPKNDNLWGNTGGKSVYDPCPAGWRVPIRKNNVSPWNGITTSNFIWRGGGRQYNNVATACFPAAGFRSASSGGSGNMGQYGYCWAASPAALQGYGFSFNEGGVTADYFNNRADSFSVRCVKE